MISKEHLEHWIGEIQYQLNGITNELKQKESGGFLSTDYIGEKAWTISGLLQNIRYDIEYDSNKSNDVLHSEDHNFDLIIKGANEHIAQLDLNPTTLNIKFARSYSQYMKEMVDIMRTVDELR